MFSLKQKFLPLSALKSSSLNIITTHDGSAPGGGPTKILSEEKFDSFTSP